MAFSHTYDTATPAGSDDPAEADDRMREIKAAVQERENVDHYWPKTGTEVSHADVGEHRKLTLRTGSAPSAVADKGFVYAKDVSGKAELFYRDEDGDEIQITTGGILNSLNLTGTQTAAGNKTLSGVIVLGDSSALATSAAPGANAQIANKKYVDDQIAAYIASEVTLSAYTNQDSESNAMLKSHAYKAATGGKVYAYATGLIATEYIKVYVGTTNDPAGAGDLIESEKLGNIGATQDRSVSALVAEDEYFEITCHRTPIILWKSMGTLSKPVDQN